VDSDDAGSVNVNFSSRLIGRERELTALSSLLARMLLGRGSVVLVSGEAGIGKTTLMESVCRDAAAHGAVVYGGRCYDLMVTPPYGPWIEIAAEYRPEEDWPPLPAFIYDRQALDDLTGQDALFEQVWEFYAALTDQRPLILVLEDLQWADEPTLKLLRFFGRRVSNRRLLLIATYRDDELSSTHPLYQFMPLVVRESKAMRVKLNRFDRIDTGEFIHDRYDLSDTDLERLLAYVQGRSEGNPFFIEELLRSLEDEGILTTDGATWTLGDLARAQLPLLVRQVVEGRLRRLNDETRRILALGAVVGEPIPLELWRTLAELSESDFADAVRPAVEQHILDEIRSSDRLRFSHALIQATLYEGVVLPQRKLWHRAAGEALAQMPAPDPSLVADHFKRAADQRAVEWLIRAGRRAQRLYAWRVAVERFEDAFELLEGDELRITERGWLCYRLGRVLCFRDPTHSRQYLDRAIQIGEQAGDELLHACAMTERGHCDGINGDYKSASELMERGLATFDHLLSYRLEPTAGQPTAESLKRGMDELRGRQVIFVGAVDNVDRVMGLTRELLARLAPDESGGNTEGRPTVWANGTANVHAALGLGFAYLGEVDRAREAFARASQLHRNPFARGLAIDSESIMVTLPYLIDQPLVLDQQVREVSRCLATSVDAGIASDDVYSMASGIQSLIRGIDWPHMMAVLARARSSDIDFFWRYQASTFLGELARRRGETELAWSEIRSLLPAGAATDPDRRPIFASTEIIVLAVNLALDAVDLPEALAWIRCYERWLKRLGTVWGLAKRDLLWAKYFRLDRNAHRARQHAEQSLANAGAPRQPLDLLAAHRFLGMLDLEAGEVADAESHLTRALELAEACLASYERALTLLVLARLRCWCGEADNARKTLDEVRAICAPLEAIPALAEANQIEQLLDHPRRDSAQQTDLTMRELEVLRLVARGMTDAEVADALFIGRRTVGAHLSSIYSKLGVRSRTEATRYAVEHDLA
jgi:DNA-binding CsgD family transcriptional regulator